MYVFMYVCMYACMHACMYVCMYVCRVQGSGLRWVSRKIRTLNDKPKAP